MRKLYKITIIITIITLVISFGIELYIDSICKNIMETNIYKEFTFDRCIRLYSNIYTGGLFEYLLLISPILIIFSVAGLISDFIHFILNKIRQQKKN